MEENKQHFLHIMLYHFKKDKNTTEMQKRNVCAVYREGAVTDRTCQMWFAKFRARDLSQTMLHDRVDQLKLITTKSRH